MKRLAALLAAAAIALLTTGTAAWGTDGCHGPDSYCHPSPTGSPSSTPTPSTDPSPTPTLTPSPSLTPSATPTPSVTPSPTPTSTPTPQPSTTPSPTPSASVVQPPAPTLTDATCDEVTTIDLPPDTKDYTYTWPHPEGDRWMAPGETETVTVTPARPGVTLIPPTSWTFTGGNAPECSAELPHTGLSLFALIAGLTLIAAGVVLYISMKEW